MNSLHLDNIDVVIGKALINKKKQIVTDNPLWLQPNKHDKIQIISWDEQDYVQICVEASKLPFLTIKEIIPVIIGVGNNQYNWAYNVKVNEFPLEFLQWNYKIIT